jgi:hypothetical protein
MRQSCIQSVQGSRLVPCFDITPAFCGRRVRGGDERDSPAPRQCLLGVSGSLPISRQSPTGSACVEPLQSLKRGDERYAEEAARFDAVRVWTSKFVDSIWLPLANVSQPRHRPRLGTRSRARIAERNGARKRCWKTNRASLCAGPCMDSNSEKYGHERVELIGEEWVVTLSEEVERPAARQDHGQCALPRQAESEAHSLSTTPR